MKKIVATALVATVIAGTVRAAEDDGRRVVTCIFPQKILTFRVVEGQLYSAAKVDGSYCLLNCYKARGSTM